MERKRRIGRLLGRRLTLLVIPHHATSPCRISVPVYRLAAAGILLLTVLGSSLFGLLRQSDYYLTKRSKQLLEKENVYFSRELMRLQDMAEELDAMQREIRRLNGRIPGGASGTAGGRGGFDPGHLSGDAALTGREFRQGIRQVEARVGDLRKGSDAIAGTPLLWPVEGTVTSPFGYRQNPFSGRREFHSGIDIAAGRGTPIVAPADGVVSEVTRNAAAGNLLVIDHRNGLVTRYAHCQRILVGPGERVERGQAVALVGNTGLSTGPHLHYEVHRDGRAVNPRHYMTFRLSAVDGEMNRQ